MKGHRHDGTARLGLTGGPRVKVKPLCGLGQAHPFLASAEVIQRLLREVRPLRHRRVAVPAASLTTALSGRSVLSGGKEEGSRGPVVGVVLFLTEEVEV